MLELSGRNKREEGVPRHLPDEFWQEGEDLQNLLLRFRIDYFEGIEPGAFEIEGVGDRMNQVAGPLLCLTTREEVREII